MTIIDRNLVYRIEGLWRELDERRRAYEQASAWKSETVFVGPDSVLSRCVTVTFPRDRVLSFLLEQVAQTELRLDALNAEAPHWPRDPRRAKALEADGEMEEPVADESAAA